MQFTVVGDGAVGKTSFLQTYITGDYDPAPSWTVGVELLEKHIDEMRKPLIFADIGGQTQFKLHRLAFYVGTDVLLLCFSLDKLETLNNLKNWKEEVFQTIGMRDIILVGTKSDRWNKDEFPFDKISEYQSKLQNELKIKIPYLQISAKTQEGLFQAHETFMKKIQEGVVYKPETFGIRVKNVKVIKTELYEILKTFVEELRGIDRLILLTRDGELITQFPDSPMMYDFQPQNLSFLAGLSERYVNLTNIKDSYTRTHIRCNNGFIIFESVSDQANLFCIANKSTKLGLIFHDIRVASRKIAEILV